MLCKAIIHINCFQYKVMGTILTSNRFWWFFNGHPEEREKSFEKYYLTGCLAPVPAEVTLLLTKVTVSVDPPTFSVSASLTPPLSWSDWMSARSLWCLSLLELFLGVAGPDPGLLGGDRLTPLPLTLLLATVFIPPRTDPGAAEGSSELVLQLEKEELLCFLKIMD